MKNQLDLLAWEPPKGGAAVIAFPQTKNIGRARHVAATYLRRTTDKSRAAYWRSACDALAGMLERSGLDEAEIGRQLAGFRSAVALELARQQHGRAQA